MRWSLIVALLLPILLIAHILCSQVVLPITIDMHGTSLFLHIGSQAIVVTQDTPLQAIQFAPHSPVVHEYQLDGSDSTNNFTLDQSYLTTFSSSFYYRFQAWMRDLDGASRWRNLNLSTNGHATSAISWPENGQTIAFQPTTSLHLSVELQRPETPMELDLIATNQAILHIKLDRNNHVIAITRANLSVANVYFPLDVAPFAAMVIDFFLLTTIWAICILLLVVLVDVWVVVFIQAIKGRVSARGTREHHDHRRIVASWYDGGNPLQFVRSLSLRLNRGPLHPIAWVALAASFVFVSWIALVQYHAQPHIYDAVAYLFAAKMYATGHLSVPIPPAVDRFPGPFMVQFQGRWFTQYAPGTSLTLVPGIWLGVPWLVEPLLGTLALLGVGLIAAQLYDRTTATLAVLLGTLSPFYSYLAASYLSHTVALCYLVWGIWALLRFLQGRSAWHVLLSAVLFGMAGLTRDLVVVLFVCIIVPGLLLLSWERIRREWRRWLLPGVAFIIVLLLFVEITLGFNKLLTDNWWTTPRSLFFSGDHWGFGPGVGFYGQHTFASGLVNLDELLTILAIDLFGWPFYLTLALLCIPFLTGKATRSDWFFLISTLLMTFAWIGYFYHGIYLGPRYLYETLPFLLILTARGIVTLNAVGHTAGDKLGSYVSKSLLRASQIVVAPMNRAVSLCTILLIGVLLACNLLYYMPRQITLYHNYSGLPSGYHLNLSTLYKQPEMHNAIITTGDYTVYQLVLFPLNDPMLHNDVIYAFASTTADYAELHKAFPGRQLYSLEIAPDGSIRYRQVLT